MSTLNVSPLQLSSRQPRDVLWGVLYLAVLVATVAIAVHSSGDGKINLNKIMKQCTSSGGGGGGSGSSTLIPELVQAAPYLGGALGLAAIFGIIWLALLRYFTKPIVYTTLFLLGAFQIALGVWLWATLKDGAGNCGATSGDCTYTLAPLILCLTGALYFLWLCCARSRIELTASLLEQSVVVVSTHPALFVASGAILLVKAAFLTLALLAIGLLLASQLVVTVVGGGECEFSWRVHGADEAQYAVLVVFLYWTVQLWLCVHYYVVSLVTGVWYFRNQSLAAQEGAVGPKEHTSAPVCVAVREALTRGFGTIAFASLIMSLCEALRRLARREARNNGLLGCLIACCISCIVAYLEFLTRFALTFAALTGDTFCRSGRTFLDTCTRHGFLKVYIVDYIAAITLNFGALVFGLAVTAATVYVVDNAVSVTPNERNAVLAAVGGVAWLLSTAVLLFLAGLLLNIVDAAYSCIVLDLDNRTRLGSFHQPAIATAVLQKVQPGSEYVVVHQPGGGHSCAHHVVAMPAVAVGQQIHP